MINLMMNFNEFFKHVESVGLEPSTSEFSPNRFRRTPRYCGVCGSRGEFMCFATVITAKTTGRTWYPLPNGENSVAERPDLPCNE